MSPSEPFNDVEAAITAADVLRYTRADLSPQQSDRIDTTVSLIEVTGNEVVRRDMVAVRTVVEQHADELVKVLGVWATDERGVHGYRVYAVEWETHDDD